MLDPSAKVESYIPDLAGTPAGAGTVRQAFDMLTGLAYTESRRLHPSRRDLEPLRPEHRAGTRRVPLARLHGRQQTDGDAFRRHLLLHQGVG